jgi:hypothetical protein
MAPADANRRWQHPWYASSGLSARCYTRGGMLNPENASSLRSRARSLSEYEFAPQAGSISTMSLLNERRATLAAAAGFALLEPRTRELELLHGWLPTWRGIGDIVVGMARQDYDLPLTRYDGRGWRATARLAGGTPPCCWKFVPMDGG